MSKNPPSEECQKLCDRILLELFASHKTPPKELDAKTWDQAHHRIKKIINKYKEGWGVFQPK